MTKTREELIQCLLATQGQSEGVTADAILSLFQAARTGGEVVEIGNLILPAVEDGEYPDCDIEWDSDAAEKLQEKLVSNEDVSLPIYVGGIPDSAAKVPEGFTEIAKNLKAQDNRMTADPLFAVLQKQEIVVDEEYDHDYIAWLNEYGCKPEPEIENQLNTMRSDVECLYFMENEIELGDDENGRSEWRRIAIKEVDEFITACFTEAGANDYLKANGHNLRKPFIYATSLFRNSEMLDLREWLLTAAPQPVGDDEVCSNCGTSLPEGCGGLFTSYGKFCLRNTQPPEDK